MASDGQVTQDRLGRSCGGDSAKWGVLLSRSTIGSMRFCESFLSLPRASGWGCIRALDVAFERLEVVLPFAISSLNDSEQSPHLLKANAACG